MTRPPGDSAPAPRAHPARLPLMALGMVSLFAALWGGLVRLGWDVRAASSVVAFHGPLMVAGFLGTVIGMERAVALGRAWPYAAPLASGLGALALIVGAGTGAGIVLLTLGSLGLVLAFVAILRRQTASFTVVMALGAGAWLAGQVLWLAGWPIHRIALWWAGFLVLTIAGERLELSRLVRVSRAGRGAFSAAVVLFVVGLAVSTVHPDSGVRLAGGGLFALALWLARHDIARRTVRQPGLTRFIALCLLAGYVWLGAAGALALVVGGVAAGGPYDALLHMLFVGFVFSMIFGHAPIIFPAVLGWRVAFRPAFYAHLILLHATLVLRVVGDLAPWAAGRRWGGLLNAVALVLFLANTAYGVLRPMTGGRGAASARPVSDRASC